MSEQVAPPPPAPQAEQAGQPEPVAPAAAPEQPEKPKGGGAKKALGIIGAIVAFLVIAALKFGAASAIGNFLNPDETAEAKAGDCIAELPEVTGTEEQSVSDAKVVKCTSTEAVYNVVGRVEDQTEAQAKTGKACEQYIKEGDDGYVFYNIAPGGKGYLLCLTKKA
ncbi:hypothetical protein GA0070216_11073 [Micromonospora matsumotoense]|uniref:Uncharacterized protein n=1 Tax=Micromonospora matsumotoense TaxID=121616 RepID=A0A1C4ZLL9_9ACTN|nr:hypothetical protein [Micromonospora matsumotoense]SCF33789.1 hypothetical protein GA0070216_11073 [Micromonospora matsumotoense]